MKDRRGASFPFSIGCMSQSAVAVAGPLEKKQQLQLQPADPPSSSPTAATQGRRSVTRRPIPEKGAGEEAAGGASEEEKAKAAASEAASGIVAAGVHRLIKGIKGLSQMFALYDNGEEEEEEEAEREIVIGYPTDVQHIGHIGWDGTNKVVGMGMVSAFSLPSSLSLRRLEIAMDAGAGSTATCTN
uniref:Uncharacterized protein n=1 Tax=Avena sativa TaxID=4498 RepID=A0ACD5WG47_AVESA